jgi:hypothetical protein
MSETSLSPVDLDVVTPPKKDYLQTVISEEKNPFHAFDWGDYLITVSATRCSYADNADASASPKGKTRLNRVFEARMEFVRTSKTYIQS